MRKLLISAAAFAALTGPALAGYLPSTKAVPAIIPPAPVFTWNGLYVGAAVGGAWTYDKLLYDQGYFPTEYTKTHGSGVLGGVFAGYNWQFSGNFVLGAEADIDGTSLDSKGTNFYDLGTFYPLTGYVIAAVPWQGSLRGRLGYAFGPALLYATGGLAFAQIDRKYVDTAASYTGSFSNVQTGWTVGGGIEYVLSGAWRVRAEYRFTEFGLPSDYISPAVNPYYEGSNRHTLTENAVKVGLIYSFGEPTPGVEKY